MNSVRNRPYGNFLPLRDAVEAIGRRMPNTIKEIDSYRSLNCCKDENSFETGAERAAIDRMLRQANAADRLLQLASAFSDSGPRWYESVGGYQIPNDSVGPEALRILVGWANQRLPPSPMPVGKWSAARNAPASRPPVEMERSLVLGFDIDELIRFLDASQVAHTLGDPSVKLSTGSANVPAELAAEHADFDTSTESSHPREQAEPGASAIEQMVQTTIEQSLDDDPVEESTASQKKMPSEVAETSSTERPRVPPLTFIGPLAEVLTKALHAARDPYNPASVYEEVLKMVAMLSPADRFPLYDCIGDDVRYKFGSELRFFTRRHMTSRYRQLKEKRTQSKDGQLAELQES